MSVETEFDYRPAPEVWAFARVATKYFQERFDHLDELGMVALFAGEEIVVHQRRKAAFVAIPQAQGQNRKIYTWALETLFGFPPDIVMVVDYEHWKTLDDHGKLGLVYHELRHVVQKEGRRGPMFDEEGRPVLELQDHDVEEFTDVAGIFGDLTGGVGRLHRANEDKDSKISKTQCRKLGRDARRITKELEGGGVLALPFDAEIGGL